MYNACSDEELLYMIRLNDEVAMNILLDRLNYSVIKTAESIVKRLGCYDVEEAKQGLRLGFMSAIDTFREDRDSSFRYFAKMCAEREVRTMMRKERYKGVASHYRSVSLDQIREEEGIYLVDMLENTRPEYNPTWYVKYSQTMEDYYECVERLPKLEREICYLRVQGFTYKEIANLLNIKVKRIDNTMQKVRKKLNRMFD